MDRMAGVLFALAITLRAAVGLLCFGLRGAGVAAIARDGRVVRR